MALIQMFLANRSLHLAYISWLIFEKVLMAINYDDRSLVEDSLVNLQNFFHEVSDFLVIICCNSSRGHKYRSLR